MALYTVTRTIREVYEVEAEAGATKAEIKLLIADPHNVTVLRETITANPPPRRSTEF